MWKWKKKTHTYVFTTASVGNLSLSTTVAGGRFFEPGPLFFSMQQQKEEEGASSFAKCSISAALMMYGWLRL